MHLKNRSKTFVLSIKKSRVVVHSKYIFISFQKKMGKTPDSKGGRVNYSNADKEIFMDIMKNADGGKLFTVVMSRTTTNDMKDRTWQRVSELFKNNTGLEVSREQCRRLFMRMKAEEKQREEERQAGEKRKREEAQRRQEEEDARRQRKQEEETRMAQKREQEELRKAQQHVEVVGVVRLQVFVLLRLLAGRMICMVLVLDRYIV